MTKPSDRSGPRSSRLGGRDPEGVPWPTAGPIAGVDEAGRGPVLGPLVVAGVLASSERAARALGVADSKTLSPARRAALDILIREKFQVEVSVLESGELDRRMARESLNDVEAAMFADVLGRLGAPRAYLDAADVVAERFGREVARRAAYAVAVRSEHRADERRATVGAASIVAKVERDRRIAEIAREYGADLGSGYVHDARTMTWLRRFVAEQGDLPACARRRWAPARELLDLHRQRRLEVA